MKTKWVWGMLSAFVVVGILVWAGCGSEASDFASMNGDELAQTAPPGGGDAAIPNRNGNGIGMMGGGNGTGNSQRPVTDRPADTPMGSGRNGMMGMTNRMGGASSGNQPLGPHMDDANAMDSDEMNEHHDAMDEHHDDMMDSDEMNEHHDAMDEHHDDMMDEHHPVIGDEPAKEARPGNPDNVRPEPPQNEPPDNHGRHHPNAG